MISLQNLDREHAFTDGDVELLTTLAASLSVALENARLIDETRQRVAELAIVNRVGQALCRAARPRRPASSCVGDQMRETFEADIVYVALHDRGDRRHRLPLLQRGRASASRSRPCRSARA